jgi:hypothetical protein
MSGPWEKFQKQESIPGRAGSISTVTRGPWEKFKEPEVHVDDNTPWYETAIDKATTGSRSFLEGMTLGLSEPVIGGINAGIQTAFGEGKGDGVIERLKSNYSQDVADRRESKARNPYTDLGGQLTGAFLPAVATMGETALVNAGKMAPTVGKAAGVGKALDVGGNVAKFATKGAGAAIDAAVPGMLAKATNPVIRGAGAVARAGIEGGTAALASEGIRQNVLEGTGYMKEGEAPSLAESAMTGAKWGAGLAALPQGYKAAKYMAKKGMSVALGPKVETIDKYLANVERINRAPTVEAIKDEMDKIALKLSDDVERGVLSRDEANQVFKAVQDNIRQVRAEASQEFSRQRHSASEAFDRAKENFSDVVRGQKEALKGVRAPIDLSGDVQSAIVDLKNMVQKGSSEAYDILGQANGKVNFHANWKGLEKARDALNVAGVGPATPQAAAAQAEIQRLIDTAGKLPSTMHLSDAKKVIQQLDRAEKAVYASGQFTDDVGQAFKSLRAGLDRQLKEQVPAYRAKMEEVAANTSLLKKLQGRFPDQRATQSKISGIHRPSAKMDYDDLAALSSATGKTFIGDIDEYVNAQRLLSNNRKLEAMAAATPEAKALEARRARFERTQHPDAGRDFVEEAVNISGLRDSEAAALQKIRDAETNLASAEARREPFRTLSPQTSQAKIESLMRDRDPIETRRMVENLDQQFGTKLAQNIEDRRILDSFGKGNTNGSRNVNLFSVMGHTFGAGTAAATGIGGAIGGPVGLFVGAATGALVDKYGPQMAKGILDQVSRIQGTPTLQKIQGLNIPPEVKGYLSSQLVRHQWEVVRGNKTRSAQQTELDNDSGTPAQYKLDPEEIRRRYLEGN